MLKQRVAGLIKANGVLASRVVTEFGVVRQVEQNMKELGKMAFRTGMELKLMPMEVFIKVNGLVV